MKRSLLITSLIATATILAACGSMNNPQERRGRGDADRGNHAAMHQAAIDACVNQAEGSAVTLKTPRGETIEAICAPSPLDGQLQAMPKPMLEHIRAMEQICVGKKAGDSVTVPNPRNANASINATCELRSGKLMPNMGKPPRDGLRPMSNAPAQ